ncbi:MAG: GNAT family N-acetyltransferase [Bryobacteraceae bacterium]|jgi:ribosomal protein S18 acetylase RimI-like enzyme
MQLVDIRQVSARALEPLLLEETAEFDRELDWDFSQSADLVRKVAVARGLGGAALLDADLLDGGHVVGYSYAVVEDRKGIIWDVYVRPAWRAGDGEALLFHALLDALIENSAVGRVESQLMLMGAGSVEALRRTGLVTLFERVLMRRDAAAELAPGRPATRLRFLIEPWDDGWLDSAARVVCTAYAGHGDGRFDDRYSTFAGARRGLWNLVEFSGCVKFCRPASYIAFDMATGRPAGISLGSFVAGEVGHIAQLCVVPDARGAGLGYELLRRSAAGLRDAGAKRISLTVTAANREAVALYTRAGFRELRRFYAYVWEAARS